ncbi:beta-ketoacyl synthase N-terminal-like domain-containing protein [Streptomyces sp. NPDC057638]|uniref:beta-ketoacyl synthase N-terminal-like domain-containing protein n=1 Tax=Streptomyces sp. NPDC057638 TaxID=3346190 RepID=UPI0036800232
MRVFVAGVGAITALGQGADVLWRGVQAGHSAIRQVTSLPMDGYPTDLGAEVPDPPLPPYDYAGPLGGTEREPALDYALIAAEEALTAAGIAVTDPAADRAYDSPPDRASDRSHDSAPDHASHRPHEPTPDHASDRPHDPTPDHASDRPHDPTPDHASDRTPDHPPRRPHNPMTDRPHDPMTGRTARRAPGTAPTSAPGQVGSLPAHRFGVVVGSCNGGLRGAERALRRARSGRAVPADRVRPLLVPPHAIAEALSAAFGLQGPCLSVNTACASGAHALAHALEVIRAGRADAMLVGGADAFTETAFAGFGGLQSLSSRPAAPYCRDRDGLSLGEGGGMLVLVAEPVARSMGAPLLAEVLGYGLSADGYHATAPHPGGEGAARAIRAALVSCGLTPDDIVYINGHGTGTPRNDAAESAAVRAALGPAAERTALSSTKSMVGHLLGAAGAVEAIVTVLALRDQIAPPTAHLTRTDPACGLDPVPGTARPMAMAVALSNNFAFAGANATVAFGRVTGPGEAGPADGGTRSPAAPGPGPGCSPATPGPGGTRSLSTPAPGRVPGADGRVGPTDTTRPDVRVGPTRTTLTTATDEPVVITGVGVLLAAGTSGERLWESYHRPPTLAGAPGPGAPGGVPFPPAPDGPRFAPVEFDPDRLTTPRERRRMDRLGQLAVGVARDALADARLTAGDGVGVVLGTCLGPLRSLGEFLLPVLADGPSAAAPALFPNTVCNAAAGQIARVVGARGPTSTVTAGHAAGASALAVAHDLLRTGRADAVVCPAVDELPPWVRSAYRALPLFGGRSGRACTLAEGGAALVLERESAARARGARILGRLAGYGSASDALGIGRWDRDGRGAERAMRAALRDAGAAPGDLTAVWAGATGVDLADRAEERALRRLAPPCPVERPLRVLGEPVGAGAVVSAVLAVTGWRRGGPGAPPGAVPADSPSRRPTGPVLVNSSSLCGTHYSLVLRPGSEN